MIEARHLTKCFNAGRQQVIAVDDVSFNVAAGEVYGLLGANGAGKTTSLRMILGLLRPDVGQALVDGYDTAVDSNAVKARIGCVTANDGLYPWLSVRETLQFFADLYGVAPDRAADQIEHLVELFGMRDYIDRRAILLSTGQKQRAVLARGLVHDPPAMLLDEPTRGLDVIGSQVVFDYIAHLRDNGKAVILSTHRLDEAERICDRFGLLHAGRLCQEGTLVELLAANNKQRLVELFQDLTRNAK